MVDETHRNDSMKLMMDARKVCSFLSLWHSEYFSWNSPRQLSGLPRMSCTVMICIDTAWVAVRSPGCFVHLKALVFLMMIKRRRTMKT